MTSFKKTLVLACAASVLSIGMAVAQTDPNAAPAAGAAPDATAAPAGGAMGSGDSMSAMPKKHMSKKHMSKKHKKHMKSM